MIFFICLIKSPWGADVDIEITNLIHRIISVQTRQNFTSGWLKTVQAKGPSLVEQ